MTPEGPIEIGPATLEEALVAERRAVEALLGFLALRWRGGWAQARTHCFVVRTPDDVLSSVFALELPLLWPDGAGGLEARPVAALDSLVTPLRYRRRGYAAALLDWVHGWAVERGMAGTALFSEIGSGYYRGLGYRVVPLPFLRGPLPPLPSGGRPDRGDGDGGSPPGAGRHFTMGDLEDVAAVYQAGGALHPLAVARDVGYWRYHLEHSRFVEDLHSDEPDVRDFVVSAGDVSAYLRSRSDGDIFTVLEAVCLPGEEPVLGALMAAEMERARGEGCLRVVMHLQPGLAPPEHLELRMSWYETFLVRPAPATAAALDGLLAGASGERPPYVFRPDYF